MPADGPNPLDALPDEGLEEVEETTEVADDLFDFDEEATPASAAASAPMQESTIDEPELEDVEAVEETFRPARRVVLRRAQPESHRLRTTLVIAFLLVHLSVLGAVIFRLSPSASRIAEPTPGPEIAREEPEPVPLAGDPKLPSPSTPAVSGPADPRARERMETAEILFARGVYHDARRHYFELLLAPPPGVEGVAMERKARLRIAQTLAREGAPALAPILLLAEEPRPAEEPIEEEPPVEEEKGGHEK